jgi:hypothetical protein
VARLFPLNSKADKWLSIFGGVLLNFCVTVIAAEIVDDSASKPTSNADYSSELPRIPPKTPADSLTAFRIHQGFRIELVASEPMLASPVAIDFDEDGRIYVAEFVDFNETNSKTPQSPGRVRLLEDTDGDGACDKSTIFLPDVRAATALCCYKGGVFVGAPPDILYAKDTDGDGKADVRRTVFTGFGYEPSGEHLLNSFRWRIAFTPPRATSAAEFATRTKRMTSPCQCAARALPSTREARNLN